MIGVRGIPNRYGGFERLVEVLGPHLAEAGYEVTVYCESPQTEIVAPSSDFWRNVRRHFVPVTTSGPLRTLQYDWRSFSAVPRDAVALIFGYGTALFQFHLKLKGVRHAVNMDGIEWQRAKWGIGARAWLRLNEFAATRLSDELIADHPEIQRYLRETRGVSSTMIAYGVAAEPFSQGPAPAHPLLDQHAGKPYLLIIARPEPENQIHLLLEAGRIACAAPMVVIGNFAANEYGLNLMRQHPQVTFAGPVYDTAVLDAMRRGAQLYLHGHSVGGTNPSLIEAMAAGAMVVAHDNPFNRWVMGDDGGLFFKSASQLAAIIAKPPTPQERSRLISAALASCQQRFLWPHILGQYESLVERLSRQ